MASWVSLTLYLKPEAQGVFWAPGPTTRHISSWGFTPRSGRRNCVLAQVPGCQGEGIGLSLLVGRLLEV